ncbi:pentapeptide repeat-containing protein [Actinoplanes sp. NPDC051343]|uniref:pentapeptide repeat-containing protein n=1 Tax=Actinoplanes sp. NPDC051343 TaxID=3363906 RepID=UPI0037A9BF01
MARADLARADLARADLARADLARAELIRVGPSEARVVRSRAERIRVGRSRAGVVRACAERIQVGPSRARVVCAGLARVERTRVGPPGAEAARVGSARPGQVRVGLARAGVARAGVVGAGVVRVRAELLRVGVSGAGSASGGLVRAALVRNRLSGTEQAGAALRGAGAARTGLVRTEGIRARKARAEPARARLTWFGLVGAQCVQAGPVGSGWAGRCAGHAETGGRRAKVAAARPEGGQSVAGTTGLVGFLVGAVGTLAGQVAAGSVRSERVGAARATAESLRAGPAASWNRSVTGTESVRAGPAAGYICAAGSGSVGAQRVGTRAANVTTRPVGVGSGAVECFGPEVNSVGAATATEAGRGTEAVTRPVPGRPAGSEYVSRAGAEPIGGSRAGRRGQPGG